jgi:hypothetical protein
MDRLELPGVSDEDHISRLADRTIRELGLQPPIDHQVVASYQGIREIKLADSDGWAGCMVQEQHGLVVYLRAADGRRRQRYTTFHEIGHTYLPGFVVRTQFRCAPSFVREKTKEERLSNTAAGELLFPRRFLRADLRHASFGLDTVEELAEKYDASLEATAHGYVRLWPEDCLLVVLELMLKPADGGGAEPRLRVAYSSHHGSWPYVPRYKSANDGSQLAAALDGEIVETRGDSLHGLVPDFKAPVELSARLMPYRDDQGRQRRRVLALYRRLPST